jgi:uncharacterized membrane protein
MKNDRVREMTLAGVFGAMILFLSLVPSPWGQWGFIRFNSGIEFTIVHIPVIIGAIFGGRRVAITLGLIFGIGSISAAAIYGGPTAVFFLNPLVSVLPRILFGFFTYLIYSGLSKAIKNPGISISLTAILSTLVHTVLVLSMLYVFFLMPDALIDVIGDETLKSLILVLLSWNMLIEVSLAAAIVTPIALRVKEFKEANNY